MYLFDRNVAYTLQYLLYNWEYLMFMLLFFFMPIVLILIAGVKVYDRVKKQKRISNVVVSAYNYKVIRNDAITLSEPIKTRISKILNTHYNVGNRYWR